MFYAEQLGPSVQETGFKTSDSYIQSRTTLFSKQLRPSGRHRAEITHFPSILPMCVCVLVLVSQPGSSLQGGQEAAAGVGASGCQVAWMLQQTSELANPRSQDGFVQCLSLEMLVHDSQALEEHQGRRFPYPRHCFWPQCRQTIVLIPYGCSHARRVLATFASPHLRADSHPTHVLVSGTSGWNQANTRVVFICTKQQKNDRTMAF